MAVISGGEALAGTVDFEFSTAVIGDGMGDVEGIFPGLLRDGAAGIADAGAVDIKVKSGAANVSSESEKRKVIVSRCFFMNVLVSFNFLLPLSTVEVVLSDSVMEKLSGICPVCRVER